jgi:hypothetical protein
MDRTARTFGNPKGRTSGPFSVYKQHKSSEDVLRKLVLSLLAVLVLCLLGRMGVYSGILLQGAVLIGLATGLAVTPTLRGPPIIDLGYSQYEGTTMSSGVNQFLGLRYAAPPLGDLRFRAPAPPLSTSRIQAATSVRLPVPQSKTIEVDWKVIVPTYLSRYKSSNIHHRSRRLPLRERLVPGFRHTKIETSRLDLYPRRRVCH